MRRGGLYAIVDPAATGGRDPLRVTQAILSGGCARLQLRSKNGSDRAHLALARRMRALCLAAGVPFVLNDRADLARLCEANGLHLGQDDVCISDARSIVGSLEIGLSTHDPTQAQTADREGADLIALGPIYATHSKQAPDPVVGIEALRAVCAATSRPVIAIGGLNAARAPAIRAAGATFGAAIHAVCGAEDPAKAAKEIHSLLEARS